MNQDIFAGEWKQMRGALKSWWGKLTDDDFERIGGVQEKYGYAREQAQHEVERRMQECGDTIAPSYSSRLVIKCSTRHRESEAYVNEALNLTTNFNGTVRVSHS